MSDDLKDVNKLEEVLLPHEVKRRAKKKQENTNDKLKAKAQAAGKSNFKNQKHVDLMAFNASAEDQFVEIVRKLIEDSGRTTIPIGTVYQEGAYELNVSPQTVKRYLIKHSAKRAALRVFGKDVMLNPNYKPDEPEEEDDSEQ